MIFPQCIIFNKHTGLPRRIRYNVSEIIVFIVYNSSHIWKMHHQLKTKVHEQPKDPQRRVEKVHKMRRIGKDITIDRKSVV